MLRRLGVGGMGEVYAAYDPDLDRRVAIKLVHSRLVDEIWQSRIVREAQALAQLSHPNVVQVYEVGVRELDELDAGAIFVVMEYVKGRTLREWIAERSADARDDVLEMFIQAGQGLVAAHAKGLVHRDFKPANVLVGDDGRPRVLDFGLVAARGADAAEDAAEDAVETRPDAGRSELAIQLTVPGTVMGTPAYMAPEQHLGEPVDARADQFSFCIALYEALYGDHPFAGVTASELRRAVLSGAVKSPPPGARVPSWLRDHLLRGLALSPEARFPDMQALLTALRADPVRRRAHRLQLVGVAIAALVSASVLLLGGRALWDSWQRAALERRAAEQLAVTERQVAYLRAEGQDDEAERVYRSFTESPEYAGTDAAVDAWIHRGRRQLAADTLPEARASFADAFARARRAEQRERASLELARVLLAQREIGGLTRLLNTLDHDAVTPARRDALVELSREAAFARRDFESLSRGAAAPSTSTRPWIVAVARSLSHATRADHKLHSVLNGALRVGDHLALNTQSPVLAAIAPALPVVAPLELPVTIATADDDPHALGLLLAGGYRREVMLRASARGLEAVRELDEHEQPIVSMARGDLDGDGRDELYLGTGAYTRRLYAVSVDDDQLARVWSPHPPTDALGSDVNALLVDDLDGDGRQELFVALGPWRAYELRALESDGQSGALRLRARALLGNVDALAVLRRADGARRLVAIKNDTMGSDEVFGAARPDGPPAGIYLLRLEGGAFAIERFVPAPSSRRGDAVVLRRPLTGDIDGDGIEDLVVSFNESFAQSTASTRDGASLILRQEEDGALSSALLANTVVHALLQLDDDPAVEVVAALRERDAEAWTLGVGDTPTPEDTSWRDTITPPPPPPRLRAAGDWRRVEELSRVGLLAEAAGTLERAAAREPERALRGDVSLWAADLQAAIGRHVKAAELYERAGELAADARALRDAADIFERFGEHARARAVSERRATLRELSEQERLDSLERSRRLARRLREETLRFEFSAPPSRGWWFARPEAARWDRARGLLELQAQGNELIAAHPLTWDGERLSIALALDVRRGDWESGVEFKLARADGGGPGSVRVAVGGGGGRLFVGVRAYSWTFSLPYAEALARGELPLEIIFTEDRRASSTTVLIRDRETGELLWEHAAMAFTREPAPGPYSLEISGYGGGLAVAEVALRWLEVSGVTPRDAPRDPQREAALALVEGRLHDALAAFETGTTPRARALRLVALARLGRAAPASTQLAELLATPRGEDEIVRLLRRDAPRYLPLARAAADDVAFTLLARAWQRAIETAPHDVAAFADLLPWLADVDALDDSALKGQLLVLRAELERRAGDLRAAYDDLERAVELVDDARPIRRLLTRIAAALGDDDAALSAARALLDQADDREGEAARLRVHAETRALARTPAWTELLDTEMLIVE